MKKLAILAIASVGLSSCTWTKHQFFGEDQTAQNPNGSGYPYYYSASAPVNPSAPGAPGAIDANEQPPYYAQQPAPQTYAQPNYSSGTYSSNPNAPSASVRFGDKGTDVSAAKVGDNIPHPNPAFPNQTTVNSEQRNAALAAQNTNLPPLPTTPQNQQPYPPQYQAPYPTTQYPASQAAPQQTPQVVSPYQTQPAYGYAQPQQLVQPQPVVTPYPIQPQPVTTGQPGNTGLTYEQYQQMYYGQQPYNAAAPYQYPPVK